jgi:hypothetical protein
MVEYISKIIRQEKETMLAYFPQSLTAKSPSEIQDEINEKFKDMLREFSKESYHKTPHGFAIYILEELNNISHNNTQYSFIDEILSKHDEQIKAKMAENDHHDQHLAETIIEPSLIGEDAADVDHV